MKKKNKHLLKFIIKFKLGKKQYELFFNYDIKRDDPQKIASEMKESLNLPVEKIAAIQKQLEKLVAKTLEESKKEEPEIIVEAPNEPPVEESSSHFLNKTKSNRSLHDVSKGMMLQPNVPYANKTVNYEIYTGNEKDRFDCPQNIQLVNKKDFVKSFQCYPHKALDSCYENQRRKSKEVDKAGTTNHFNTILGCYTASHLQDEIDRNEIMEIIETIENKHTDKS